MRLVPGDFFLKLIDLAVAADSNSVSRTSASPSVSALASLSSFPTGAAFSACWLLPWAPEIHAVTSITPLGVPPTIFRKDPKHIFVEISGHSARLQRSQRAHLPATPETPRISRGLPGATSRTQSHRSAPLYRRPKLPFKMIRRTPARRRKSPSSGPIPSCTRRNSDGPRSARQSPPTSPMYACREKTQFIERWNHVFSQFPQIPGCNRCAVL